jgi:hypothetical protein
MYPEAPVTRQRTGDDMLSSVTRARRGDHERGGGQACALPPARRFDLDVPRRLRGHSPGRDRDRHPACRTLDRRPGDAMGASSLLLAVGAAVVTIAECALAAEAFEPITVAADVLERSAAALRREADKALRHLGVRLRLAITEARSPLGADDAGWEELQRKATGWKLDDRDAALVLSRYARTRAWAGAFADADAAWQRGAEFATRARLFTDIAGWLSAR